MNFSAIPARSLVGKLLRLPLRLLPARTCIPVLQGPLRGKRWIVGAGNHSCWLGCYETGKQEQLRTLIRPGDTVYDLGANSGYFSLLCSLLTGPAGRVIAFEPLPANILLLNRHLSLNRIANCTVVETAVSDREGTGSFLVTPNRSMGRLEAAGNNEPDSVPVRIVTLDGMVARGEIPPPALIKCDVEGAELNVLRGASMVLKTYHPTILIDMHRDDIQAECGFLANLGYRLRTLDGLPLPESGEILATWSAAPG